MLPLDGDLRRPAAPLGILTASCLGVHDLTLGTEPLAEAGVRPCG